MSGLCARRRAGFEANSQQDYSDSAAILQAGRRATACVCYTLRRSKRKGAAITVIDIRDMTISRAARALRAGECSAQELTTTYLARIQQRDPDMNSFLRVTPERALVQAEAADERLAAGETGPLLGIPLAIKDNISRAGVETTAGSRILTGYVPPFSATVIERLEAAGAIFLGTTNMDEFGMGSSNENSAFGPVRNPWSAERVPGGSSGGSAAAVSAGLCAGALGSDTGGSIRQPGSFTGLVALKPSYGRVSRWGLVAFGSSLEQIGPLARTVEDTALILQAIAGPDARDATCADEAVPDYAAALAQEDIRGTRIGVPREYFVDELPSEIRNSVETALAEYEALGAELVPLSLPLTRYAVPTYYLIASSEASANLARYDGVRYGQRVTGDSLWESYQRTRAAAGFGPEAKRRIMLGTYALSAGYYEAYYGKASQVRALIRDEFADAFEQVDLLATPTTPSTAFRFGEKLDDPLQMYLADVFVIPASLAGICGISIPCGFDEAGLPIGLQLLGPAFGEVRLLQAAAAYQRVTNWHRRLPPEKRG